MTATAFQAATMNHGAFLQKFSGKSNTATVPLLSAQARQSHDTFCSTSQTKNSNSVAIPAASTYHAQPFQLTFQASAIGFNIPEEHTTGTYKKAEFTQHEASNGANKMTFIRFKNANPAAVGAKAAELLQSHITACLDGDQAAKPLIITPTGNTPLPFYKALRENNVIPWEKLYLGHLDEYIQKPGLKLPDEETYRFYMRKQLWDHLNLDSDKAWAIADQPTFNRERQATKTPEDYQQAIQNYEKRIEDHGGPLTVVLGIGNNGHIAFIEPLGRGHGQDEAQRKEAWLDENSPAHWTKLKESTINANFGERTQRIFNGYTDEAVTLGLNTILSAKHIILLATGNSKKSIVKRAFREINEEPTPYIPATFLKDHPDVTVITDF